MSATTARELTQEAFDRLLLWLDPDRNRAGQKYEEIRLELIKIFVVRGCAMPEDLADDTINRVAKNLSQVVDAYVGRPALYFYGVARLVYLEESRRRIEPCLIVQHETPEHIEQRYECLEKCLACLNPNSRSLILEYYTN